MTHSPLILTLRFDQTTFEALDALRQAHFPPERNVVPAHVTLFHALPGNQEREIQQTLQELCAATMIVPVSFPAVRFLGRGVALEVESPGLVDLRKQLATAWHTLLGAQDRQGYRPHVTIQNKVAPTQARQLYDELAAGWQPFGGEGVGLTLWRYLGGPWERIDTFALNGASD